MYLCWVGPGSIIAGQEAFYTDKVYKPGIKTVLLHRAGWEMTYPIIDLNSLDRIELSFDDLSDQVKNFSYTIEHCSADWLSSRLSPGEYMDGFEENPIQDYSLSFNTTVNYVHYSIRLPNDEVRFKISGNYILKVFEDFDQSNLVLTRRFSVAEPMVSIEGKAGRPPQASYRDEGQQVNFQVHLGTLEVNDPYSEVKVAILQNNRWNMSVLDLKPFFSRGDVLDYNYPQENIFKGGNEYRYFNIKSLRYQSEAVRSIDYRAPYYHVFLYPDRPRDRGAYFYHEDFNGRYYVEVQEGVKNETESDYVYVHFTLPFDAPLAGGGIFVSGNLSNWDYTEDNKMVYNYESKAYELEMLLKQGYYNYEYAYIRDGSDFPDATFIEGSYYETENDYVIYVYLRTNTSRYDRLVGYQFLNSLH